MANWEQFSRAPKRSSRPRNIPKTKLTKAERELAARMGLKRVKTLYDLGHLNTDLVYAEVQRAVNVLSTDEISHIMGMPYWEVLEKFREE